jgi:hypothetical protein
MECQEVRHRLADYLRSGLDQPTHIGLQAHLERCDACRDEADALETIWAGLGEIDPGQPDRRLMRARFDRMLDGYAEGLAAAGASGVWQGMNARVAGWWPAWSHQPLAQAGIAAAMLFIGVCAGPMMRAAPVPPAPAADLVELRRELQGMREMLTLSLMQQQSATERLRGVSGSNQIEQPGSEIVRALLDTLMHDSNVNVRLASVDALRRFATQDTVRRGTVDALRESSFPLVQIAIIDFVVETKDRQAADALRRLAGDASANEAVRGRAAWGLQQLNL